MSRASVRGPGVVSGLPRPAICVAVLTRARSLDHTGLLFIVPAMAWELWSGASPGAAGVDLQPAHLLQLGGYMVFNGVFYTTYNLFSFLVLLGLNLTRRRASLVS